jgi:hypothetical protein
VFFHAAGLQNDGGFHESEIQGLYTTNGGVADKEYIYSGQRLIVVEK